MQMSRPTIIRNWDLALQRLDFTGLQNGAIHPSDIDGVIELNNDVLVLLEIKRYGYEIQTGQKLLLQRLADRWGERAVVIFATHISDNPMVPIPAEICTVEAVYHNGKWNKKGNINLVDALNKLGEHWKCDKLKF